MQLWIIWLVWILWILDVLFPEVSLLKESAILITGIALFLFIFSLLRKGFFMRLLKRESKKADDSVQGKMPEKALTDSALIPPAAGSLSAGDADVLKPVRTRKDTFISPEARLNGNLEAQGNIVIEGQLDGNIYSSHQVRIESGGRVTGDIHAQHIVINGDAKGNFHAETLTLQPEGRVEGTIYSDGLVIEKGGVFIGQSSLGQSETKAVAGKGIVKPITAAQDQKSSSAPVAIINTDHRPDEKGHS
ncbi:hypothetical protein BLD47_17215 [Erwinia sp. OLCASP19]|nr:hypothetical protein BLD47_17215 [Erwinia sp. OLCASP19]